MEVDADELLSLVNQAADCLDASDGAGAKALCQQAIKLYSECEYAWGNLAFAEIQLGNLEAAFTAAREAVSINPAYASGWHNLGEACARTERWEESLTFNNRAIELDSSSPVYHLGKGTALAGLRRFSEAIESFDKALELDPSHIGALMNREAAHIQADPNKTKALSILFGAADALESGRLNSAGARLLMRSLATQMSDTVNLQLVRSFDCFARLNILAAKPAIVGFCSLNRVLAELVGDQETMRLCEQREKEAKEMARRIGAK